MKNQNEQPKMYRCLAANMYFYYDKGKEYEATQKALPHLKTVEELAKENPKAWQLVEPDPKPFAHIVHKGDKGNNKIENLEWVGPIPPTKTHLSESQHQSLVGVVYTALVDLNMHLDCREICENRVREWAETNNVQLP